MHIMHTHTHTLSLSHTQAILRRDQDLPGLNYGGGGSGSNGVIISSGSGKATSSALQEKVEEMHEMTQNAVAELRGWMLSEMQAVQRQQQRLVDTCARQEQALQRIEALLAGDECAVGEAKGCDTESGGWQVRDQERTGVLSLMHANVCAHI